MFNAAIYLENKTKIGKVDEIFGQITEPVCAMSCTHMCRCCRHATLDRITHGTLPLYSFSPSRWTTALSQPVTAVGTNSS